MTQWLGACVAPLPRVCRFTDVASPRASEPLGTNSKPTLRRDGGICVCACVCRHVTLRAGEVLEVCGESGSGKTEVVMQAAVVSVLPRLYNGVSYGGNEGGVILMDLDGKFDMHRFMQLLSARITATHAAICRERRSAALSPACPRVYKPHYKRLPAPRRRVHERFISFRYPDSGRSHAIRVRISYTDTRLE